MENEQDREAGQLKHRWQRINDHVCKFVACYETALKQQSSGQNENDVMKAAHHIFYNDHMFKFNLEHAWWKAKKKVDATTTHSESSQTQSVDIEEGFEGSNKEKRPQGVKAAKAAKMKGVHTGGQEGEDDMKKLKTM
ncbi:glutathione S-transferase T2-like [Eutrema salsugineum]|uniref:glutathione S-transferase T2-like n=1 Tax=Eutrema salsugineum TaxID=72664 RepID=UPI000CED7DB9|nr:glutathione S-transferase T2-like [Eutrema salsugineum]